MPYFESVRSYLLAEHEAGTVRVEDVDFAATQFLGMISNYVFWPALLVPGLGGERRTRRSGGRRGRPHHRRPVRRDWTRGVHQRLSPAASGSVRCARDRMPRTRTSIGTRRTPSPVPDMISSSSAACTRGYSLCFGAQVDRLASRGCRPAPGLQAVGVLRRDRGRRTSVSMSIAPRPALSAGRRLRPGVSRRASAMRSGLGPAHGGGLERPVRARGGAASTSGLPRRSDRSRRGGRARASADARRR